ncbi:hypothetical protein ABZX62_32205 [Streptomyces flavidovirens]|uniref:hypothetical protein n=1 Tax=Streptomyces flavidovirens TaxID=67298 RepID=UPI0033A67889
MEADRLVVAAPVAYRAAPSSPVEDLASVVVHAAASAVRDEEASHLRAAAASEPPAAVPALEAARAVQQLGVVPEADPAWAAWAVVPEPARPAEAALEPVAEEPWQRLAAA